MFRVNGLYGHIQYNNLKTAVLIASFLALSVCISVSTLQLGRHAFKAGKGEQNFAILRQSIESPVFSFNSRAPRQAARPLPAASPEPGKAAEDGPLDLSNIPLINRPAVYMFFASPLEQAKWSLLVALVYLVGATWWNSQFIRYAVRAKPLKRSVNPELYNLVENLAMSVGIPCPAIEVVPSPQLNAYACGLTPSAARIGVTTGLVDRLSRRELEAVLAHELSHILNRDSRLMAVTKSCVDLVALKPIRYFQKMRRNPVVALPIAVLFYTGAMNPVFYLGLLGNVAGAIGLAFLCKAMVLQTREFVADAGAVELTKSPEALISALRKICGDEYVAAGSPFAQAMMIFGPSSGLFSTHPSLDDRVGALCRFGGLAAELEAEAPKDPLIENGEPRPAEPRVRRVAGLSGFDASRIPTTPVAARSSAPARRTTIARAAFTAMPLQPSGLQAQARSVWQTTATASQDGVAQSQLGDSWFERWVMSGRINRIAKTVGAARRKASFAILWVQAVVVLMAFVIMHR